MKKLLVWMSLVLVAGVFTNAQALGKSKPAEKEWTFLVFLNGHNNLDSFGHEDMNEMEVVGSTDKINVVVQWASLAANTTKRVYVKKDNDFNQVTSPVVEEMPVTNMGDYRNLIEFVRWGVTNYPAKHYFIDVWNHGSGWHLKRLSRRSGGGFQITDISNDDRFRSKMTTEQLGIALQESARIIGRKVDIYGSDACLMSMVEVAGQMQDAVDVFVGSQDLEPGAGWPYHDFLKAWSTESNPTPARVSQHLVKTMVDSYRSGGSQGQNEATLSSFDLNKLPRFSETFKRLNDHLKTLSTAELSKVLSAGRDARSFWESDYVDVDETLKLLVEKGVSTQSNELIQDVRTALADMVIANDTTPDYQWAKGVSFWFPTDRYTYDRHSQRYKALEFDKDTGWADFLRKLF